MASANFREDFVQQRGVTMLCSALEQLQAEIAIWESAKVDGEIDILKTKMVDEFHCIMCIKFVARDLTGCQEIVNSTPNLRIISQSLFSPCTQSRVATMDVLANLIRLDPQNALRPVLQQFTGLRVKYAQEDRFRFLVNSSTQSQDKIGLLFKASLLGLMNEMLMACPNGNYQVYLQTELEESGFNLHEVEKNATNLTRIDESFEDAGNVIRQAALWRENYIMVDRPRKIPSPHRNNGVTTNLVLPTYQYGNASPVSTNLHSPASRIPPPPAPVLPKKQADIQVVVQAATPPFGSSSSQQSLQTLPPRTFDNSSSSKRALSNIFPDVKLASTSPKTIPKMPPEPIKKFGAPTLQINSSNLNQRMASKFSTEYHEWKRRRSGDSVDSGESSDSTESALENRHGAVFLVDGISPAQRTMIDDVLGQFDRAFDVLDHPTPDE